MSFSENAKRLFGEGRQPMIVSLNRDHTKEVATDRQMELAASVGVGGFVVHPGPNWQSVDDAWGIEPEILADVKYAARLGDRQCVSMVNYVHQTTAKELGLDDRSKFYGWLGQESHWAKTRGWFEDGGFLDAQAIGWFERRGSIAPRILHASAQPIGPRTGDGYTHILLGEGWYIESTSGPKYKMLKDSAAKMLTLAKFEWDSPMMERIGAKEGLWMLLIYDGILPWIDDRTLWDKWCPFFEEHIKPEIT